MSDETVYATEPPTTPGWYAVSRTRPAGSAKAAYWDGRDWAGLSKWSDFRSVRCFASKDEAIDYGISLNL